MANSFLAFMAGVQVLKSNVLLILLGFPTCHFTAFLNVIGGSPEK